MPNACIIIYCCNENPIAPLKSHGIVSSSGRSAGAAQFHVVYEADAAEEGGDGNHGALSRNMLYRPQLCRVNHLQQERWHYSAADICMAGMAPQARSMLC